MRQRGVKMMTTVKGNKGNRLVRLVPGLKRTLLAVTLVGCLLAMRARKPPQLSGTHNNKSGTASCNWIRELWEKPCKSQGYSQYNQDCMLDAIFENIGTTNKFFVEYGFNTKKQCSGSGPNTCKLWSKHGWKGLLLDANNENPSINLKAHFLYKDNIGSILKKYNVPQEFDFLSSDMDSHDLFVLQGLLESKFQPRVVTTEFNSNWTPEWEMTQVDPSLDEELKKEAMNQWENKQCVWSASASAIRLIMEKHGYVLIGVSDKYLDLFWARRELVESCDIPTFEQFMDSDIMGKIRKKPQTDLNFLKWLVDARVWEATNDIRMAQAAAKKKLVASAKAGTLGPCFAEVQDKLKAETL